MPDPEPDPAETRGGLHPDWERAEPGKKLPEKPPPEIPEGGDAA